MTYPFSHERSRRKNASGLVPAPGGSVLSVNVGRATAVGYSSAGRTGINKQPVSHPVSVSAPGPKHVAGSGLAGDDVCDLRHHGGDDQAVYAYAREDLDRWSDDLGRPLANGSFGENLTTSGIDVSGAIVGEQWAVGPDLVLEISDPRIPCRTFADFLGERGWVRKFTQRSAPGTYLRVLRPGSVVAGDAIEVIHRPVHGFSVSAVFRAFTTDRARLTDLTGLDTLSAEARGVVAKAVIAQAAVG